jgi:hypothetical protein
LGLGLCGQQQGLGAGGNDADPIGKQQDNREGDNECGKNITSGAEAARN